MSLNNIADQVQDHERRIVELERNQAELKNGMLRIENTVLQESSTQKELLNKLVEHHFGIKTKMLDSKTKIVLGLLGSGGLASFITLLFQWFTK